jgi:D-alanyl-D-alanine carboxypeptidase
LALLRDADGALAGVFGLPLAEAGPALFPVSHARAIPREYVPPDITYEFGHPLRALIGDDLRAMRAAAEAEHAYLEVISGFRSYEEQANLFDDAVDRQRARNPSGDQNEAEQRAARFIALPGHSQHQLGTTADLSSWEIGYTIQSAFARTTAGRWLAERGPAFGFILPYTTASESRTGYVFEPWHIRWVGRPLAAFLADHDYQHSTFPTADDWLAALEELVNQASALS